MAFRFARQPSKVRPLRTDSISRSNVAGALQSQKGMNVNFYSPFPFENAPKRSLLGIQAYLGYKLSFGFLNPEDGTDRFYRNVGNKLPIFAA
jgi:hypothetical protein